MFLVQVPLYRCRGFQRGQSKLELLGLFRIDRLGLEERDKKLEVRLRGVSARAFPRAYDGNAMADSVIQMCLHRTELVVGQDKDLRESWEGDSLEDGERRRVGQRKAYL